jgi:hypothetical protein
MNTRSSILIASLLGFSLLGSLTAVAEPPAKAGKAAPAGAAGDISALSGKFKYAGAKDEKGVITDQIDKILFTLDESMRMPAKERLEMKTRIAEWIDIKQNGSKVTITFEGRKAGDVCSLEGPTSGMDSEGNPAELRVRKEGNNLVHVVTTAEGTRTNTFQPQPDGSYKLAVELAGPRLAKPFRYTLTYKKSK